MTGWLSVLHCAFVHMRGFGWTLSDTCMLLQHFSVTRRFAFAHVHSRLREEQGEMRNDNTLRRVALVTTSTSHRTVRQAEDTEEPGNGKALWP